MEQLNEGAPKRVNRYLTAGDPLPPEQLWRMLNVPQQQGVFRLLVGVCQDWLRHHTRDEQEVTHEPR